jgi:hypothetical protein
MYVMHYTIHHYIIHYNIEQMGHSSTDMGLIYIHTYIHTYIHIYSVEIIMRAAYTYANEDM